MTRAEQIEVGHTHWEFENIAHPTETMAGNVEHKGRIEAVAPASAPDLQKESLHWKEHVTHLLAGRAGRFYARRSVVVRRPAAS